MSQAQGYEPEPNPLATTSLCLGIAAVLAFWGLFPLWACLLLLGALINIGISLPLGIGAVITGVIARKKAKSGYVGGEETGLAGTVCGIVAISYNVIAIIAIIALMAFVGLKMLEQKMKFG